jgi:phosphoribosyl 1,2-cyclic phosphate phosphodiesterase
VKLTFLGTGTSFGIPVIGCRCPVCTSTDPRDSRTRHAALLSWNDGRRVLVDTPPEIRLQLVRAGVERVDAVWFTHLHADHLHGIDDLRIFSLRTGHSVPAYASEDAKKVLERRFEYIFDPSMQPEAGSSKPEVSLHTVHAGEAEEIAGERFMPLEVRHGSLRVLGFRVGNLGYITDAKDLPPETLAALEGLDVLVLNALWWGNPHPTHFNVEEALEVAERLGPSRTFLTHLTHRVSHEELARRLPAGVVAAYDGLSIEIASSVRS